MLISSWCIALLSVLVVPLVLPSTAICHGFAVLPTSNPAHNTQSGFVLSRHQHKLDDCSYTGNTDGGAWEEDDHSQQELDEHSSDESSTHTLDAHEPETSIINTLVDEHKQWILAINKAAEALFKKQTSLENELSKAAKIEETVQRAQLIVNNLYLFQNQDTTAHNSKHAVVVQDWENDGIDVELTLNPNFASAAEEADALFVQARKLKRGSKVIQALLEQTQQARQILEDAANDLSGDDCSLVEEGRLGLVQDRLRRTASQTNFQEPQSPTKQQQQQQQHRQPSQQSSRDRNKKPTLGTPASNVRKILSPHSGCPILVGRNRRGNDYLSTSHARGDDVWMHARGIPGAHVVVQRRRGQEQVPTEACLQLAANLAAFYSDDRNEATVPITVAEPKHLIKPRSAPLGAIQVRQEAQVVYGRPADVPEELQEARAQSGQVGAADGAYRRADKAQRKKKTAAAAQKRKQQLKSKKQQERSEDKRVF